MFNESKPEARFAVSFSACAIVKDLDGKEAYVARIPYTIKRLGGACDTMMLFLQARHFVYKHAASAMNAQLFHRFNLDIRVSVQVTNPDKLDQAEYSRAEMLCDAVEAKLQREINGLFKAD